MYHHFKDEGLSRSDEIQRLVTQRILDSDVSDKSRENSIVWECKHSSSCLQVGRILALKRGLDLELTEVICALHDIYAIETGKYEKHAKHGAVIAREILEETGNFSHEEIDIVCTAIANHSDKHIESDDPYSELIKDADTYDCSLYDGTIAYYKEHKSPESFACYRKRAQAVSDELGVPLHPSFTV